MNRLIKFRAWIADDKQMVYSFRINSQTGKFVTLGNDGKWIDADFPIMQYSGFDDKSKKEIYEGDIIKFKYFVGDFTWEFMSEEEAKSQSEMVGKQYTGVIQCNLTSVNLDIICGNTNSTHMIFPLLYATHSKVIGNIFQNPELLK